MTATPLVAVEAVVPVCRANAALCIQIEGGFEMTTPKVSDLVTPPDNGGEVIQIVDLRYNGSDLQMRCVVRDGTYDAALVWRNVPQHDKK